MKIHMSRGIKITASILAAAVVTVSVCNIAGKVLESKKQKGLSAGSEWSDNQKFSVDRIRKLDMGSSDFRILCLTDIHLKNYGTFAAWLGINYILDTAGYIALSRLIGDQKPDLIVLTGDIVCTMKNDIELQKFSDFMDEFKTPWAFVFGNHDEEGRADKAKLCDILQSSKYGLFEYGAANLHGAGNYVVNLTRNGEIMYSLYMMDSGAVIDIGGENHEDSINENQIKWYEWSANGINSAAGKTVPNMAFFHITLPQYNDVSEYEFGEKCEKSYPQYVDCGFFDAFKENGGTHVFAGHDHNNNFLGEYEGVKLCYVQKSSYNCYFKSSMTGGTLVTISPDNKVRAELVSF